MKPIHAPALLLALTLTAAAIPPSAAGDLDAFSAEVDIAAQADLGAFRADLRATFGVSTREIDGLFAICDRPGDVYLALRVGQVARLPVERVVTEYRSHRGKGWGVIAKNLGIKPGSPEFHALKQRGRVADGSSPGKARPAKRAKRGK